MNKFKVGDRVVILQREQTGDAPVCTPEMVKVANLNEVRIVAGYDWHYVKLEGMQFVWDEEWLGHAYEYDSL